MGRGLFFSVMSLGDISSTVKSSLWILSSTLYRESALSEQSNARQNAVCNVYLDDYQLKGQVRVAAARSGLTLSQYCVSAIRRRLAEEGIGSP